MTLQEVYDKAKARLPEELHSRLERALGIVRGDGGYDVQQSDMVNDIWKVSYERHGEETIYIIDHKEKLCTCPDFTSAKAGLCKHRLAVMLLKRLDTPLANHRSKDMVYISSHTFRYMQKSGNTKLLMKVSCDGVTYTIEIKEC